jgi:hypothetical protein
VSDPSPTSGHAADPERIIDKIHQDEARAGTNHGDRRPRTLSWHDPDHRDLVLEKFAENGDVNLPLLPGFGPDGDASNARDSCGDPYPFACNDCGQAVNIGDTCGMSVCARCAVAWARDRGIANASKVRRVRKEKNWHTPDDEHQYLHHASISARLGWWYTLARGGYTLAEAYDKFFETVKFILDEMRAQGVVAQHSYRGKKDDGSLARGGDEMEQIVDDQGKWKERLFHQRPWHGDVRDEVAWNPHAHGIVVADFFRGQEFTKQIEEETGFIIQRIADDDGVSLKNDGAMARALTYTISHADILVHEDANNKSMIRRVGSFQGDPIDGASRFSPRPHDEEWARNAVERYAETVLGLYSTSTECGAELPDVDDPDELARRIIDELYPQHEPKDRPEPDLVLYHVAAGNIGVEVSTTSGGGGSVSVTDAFGEPVPRGGWGNLGELPDAPGTAVAGDGGADAVRAVLDEDDGHDHGNECGCDDQEDDDGTCSGKLIPLQEFRERGYLDDEEWRRSAPHVDEAEEADREWPDDLDPWRTTAPDGLIGAG